MTNENPTAWYNMKDQFAERMTHLKILARPRPSCPKLPVKYKQNAHAQVILR